MYCIIVEYYDDRITDYYEKYRDHWISEGFLEMTPGFYVAPEDYSPVECVIAVQSILEKEADLQHDVLNIQLGRIQDMCSMMEVLNTEF